MTVAMRHSLTLAVLGAALVAGSAAAVAEPVLTYHGTPDRNGRFVVPALTFERARSLRLDEGFHPKLAGHVYDQPLYWQSPGSGGAMLLVATEDNMVHAIDASTGRAIWERSVGQPVPRSALPCGNINPLGVTGTPVISESAQAIYLNAAVNGASGPRHLVFALSLKDGSPLPGWPLDVAEILNREYGGFLPRDQGQRGALAILDRTLYVPFGGHFGDCGRYRGVILGISLADPRNVHSWATRAQGAGIWAPGGVASDGKSLFVATGNGLDPRSWGARAWKDAEAVIRLAPDLRHSEDSHDYFAPADWVTLDQQDADLGGTNPLPLDVPAAGGSQPRVLALGKDRKAYLLDRRNLGGIGGSLAAETVATRSIITSPAAYPAADGMWVAFAGPGAQCPYSDPGIGLTVLKIRATPPLIGTAWCASVRGGGAPIVTTTDGHSDPIVWILGAEGDNRLHGFRGDTGEPLVTAPTEPMSGLRHLQTLIATQDHLYVAADGTVYAFTF
jgi:hypothetical protein